MEVLDLKVEAHPKGHRVDLSWTNPADANFRGVKVLRRETTYPELPGDLNTVFEIRDEPISMAPAGASVRFSDLGLKSETVYYYAIAAYDNTLPVATYFPVFVSCMATGAYQSAGTMYQKLPALYQRFDLSKPPKAPELDPADQDKGQLLRLMELVGPQLDLLRSFARAGADFSDVQRVDSDLLSLLATWIGWESSARLSLAKRRNEIAYAPHFYRTVGIAANLGAMLNRVTPWSARIKEFVHNVFLSNEPEQLTLWEIDQLGVPGHEPQLVTLDFAYEGKPVAVRAADGAQWLFYQAQRSVPTTQGPEDRWQIYCKVNDQGRWLASRRLTVGRADKYPAVVQRPDGSFLLFWTAHESAGGKVMPQILSEVFSAGHDARRPQRLGTLAGPFVFTDGEVFNITVTADGKSISRIVTLHLEHFHTVNLVTSTATATADEIAALLNREIPGVEVSVNQDNHVLIEAVAGGSTSSLNLTASSVATKLGLATGITNGTDATTARLLSGGVEKFALAAGDTLSVRIDADSTIKITFAASDFSDILTGATAEEVAAAINRVRPRVASAAAGRLRLSSPSSGAGSFVTVLLDSSTAAGKLGFGVALPPAAPQPAPDTEPTAFTDAGNNVWLFWSSRRAGPWNIWYSRFDGTTWGAPKQVTGGLEADREPCAVFDSAGRIWVSWSRRKTVGLPRSLWNVFYRTTTDLDFNLAQNWVERELAPVPADFENREPAAIVTAANTIQLFFASSGTDGWHIRSTQITPASQGAVQPITSGQFSHRAPAALRVGPVTRLWFRNNESREYISSVYPAARTLDSRYGGSTTVVATNAKKISAWEQLDDIQRYSYDTAKSTQDWYARDTIGIFLTADTSDPKVIEKTSLTIENVVMRFLPIQTRVVLIITNTAGFRFLRTWKSGVETGVLPNLKVSPLDLSFRLFQGDVTEGV